MGEQIKITPVLKRMGVCFPLAFSVSYFMSYFFESDAQTQ